MTTLVRIPNWDIALVHLARNVQGEPFCWGETDCGTLCYRAVAVMYGEGEAEDRFGGPWQSLHDARERWAEIGGAHGAMDALEAYEATPRSVRSGDILLFDGADPDSLPRLAFVAGGKVVTVDRKEGVRIVPVRDVVDPFVVWRLP